MSKLQTIDADTFRLPPPTLKGETGQQPGPTAISQETEDIMGEKRKRNQTLTVRLTPKERSEIIRRAEKSRMSLTDYILAASTQTEIHVAEDTRPLIAELKRIGNNLNQITMKINAGAFQSYNFHEVLDMQRAIYEELRRIGKG